MKIAVLGAGAMGSIYGGHLSTNNDVYMIDKKAELVDKINADGLKLFENDTDVIYHPAALLSSEGIGEVDLVIIFVKALYSRAALMENKGIIGELWRTLETALWKSICARLFLLTFAPVI